MKCLSGYDFCNSAVTNAKAVVASTPYANTCYEAELGCKKKGEREIDCHVNSVATPRVVTGTHIFTTQVCSSLVNAQKAVNVSKVKHTNSSHHFPLVIDSEHYYTNKSTPNKEEMRADVTSVEASIQLEKWSTTKELSFADTKLWSVGGKPGHDLMKETAVTRSAKTTLESEAGTLVKRTGALSLKNSPEKQRTQLPESFSLARLINEGTFVDSAYSVQPQKMNGVMNNYSEDPEMFETLSDASNILTMETTAGTPAAEFVDLRSNTVLSDIRVPSFITATKLPDAKKPLAVVMGRQETVSTSNSVNASPAEQPIVQHDVTTFSGETNIDYSDNCVEITNEQNAQNPEEHDSPLAVEWVETAPMIVNILPAKQSTAHPDISIVYSENLGIQSGINHGNNNDLSVKRCLDVPLILENTPTAYEQSMLQSNPPLYTDYPHINSGMILGDDDLLSSSKHQEPDLQTAAQISLEAALGRFESAPTLVSGFSVAEHQIVRSDTPTCPKRPLVSRGSGHGVNKQVSVRREPVYGTAQPEEPFLTIFERHESNPLLLSKVLSTE